LVENADPRLEQRVVIQRRAGGADTLRALGRAEFDGHNRVARAQEEIEAILAERAGERMD